MFGETANAFNNKCNGRSSAQVVAGNQPPVWDTSIKNVGRKTQRSFQKQKVKQYVPNRPVQRTCDKNNSKGHRSNLVAQKCTGTGRIGPLPNRPSANWPPKKVGPGQIGPLKIRPWTNRTPVENFCNWNLFIDLQRAFNLVDKDISSGLLQQKNKGSFSTETTCLN